MIVGVPKIVARLVTKMLVAPLLAAIIVDLHQVIVAVLAVLAIAVLVDKVLALARAVDLPIADLPLMADPIIVVRLRWLIAARQNAVMATWLIAELVVVVR